MWSQLWFIIKAMLLGVVEGVTEFLPVSSTGHLIIAVDIFGLPEGKFMNMFNVVIQLGAILAVVWLFWDKLVLKGRSFFKGEAEGRKFLMVWILGCIPAAVLGVLLDDLIDKYLFSVWTVILALVVGAGLMLYLEQAIKPHRFKKEIEDISAKDALVVGAWQCLAMWPGFSRSASTIMGGWFSGMSTSVAAEYSFFLAIPVMFGASGLKLAKFDFAGVQMYQYIALIVGFLTAFVTALFVVKAFMGFLKKNGLRVFAYYRVILAIVLLLWKLIF